MKDLTAKIKRRLQGDSYFKEVNHITDTNQPVYYIIRRVPFGEGFFSNYFYVLSHVVYACQKGWHPVVDMENYRTLYHDRDAAGNLWEKYFEPMGGSTLEQAYRSKNYVLSSGRYLSESGVPVYEINQGHITDDMVSNLQPYISKYMKINHNIMNDVELYKLRNSWECTKIIGVHVRGTDMHIERNEHTVSPKVENIFKDIDSLLAVDESQRIFLCTDEQNVVERFVEKYKERVIFCNEYRSISNDGIGIHKEKGKQIRKSHKYLLGREILIDMVLLSQCYGLICGISNVTNAALLLNNKSYNQVQVLR
ncbi:MAG: hypothetical protein NC489_16710 [Ruminococcus flavefaciens]|nr:hypothetical protein [Ruminococcus flavefaciens]